MMASSTFDFGRLSPSSMSALSYADEYRKDFDMGEIHVEHLLMGLYDSKPDAPAKMILSKAGIDRQELVERLKLIDKNVAPEPTTGSLEQISQIPPLSEHASRAIEKAFKLSEESRWDNVKSRHLFAGIFGVSECEVSRALPEVLPYLEDMVPEFASFAPPTEPQMKMADQAPPKYEQSTDIDEADVEDEMPDRKSSEQDQDLPIPRWRNTNFTGREDILADIHKILTSAGQSVFLTGKPGVGKTEIAVEYAYRHRNEFGAIQLIDASSPQMPATSIGEADNLINRPFNEMPSNADSLVIFDDAPNKVALLEVVPKLLNNPSVRMMITSRDEDWYEFGGSVLNISNFDQEEAKHFLERRLGDLYDDPDAAIIITKKSEGLPLYLEMFCQDIVEKNVPLSRQNLDAILPDLDRKISDKIGEIRQTWEFDLLKKQSAEPMGPRAWVETDAIPVVGSIRSGYRPSEYDSLDAEEQAGMLATLLITKDVQPPFAIGLLGDWGVGKTFFMRLMQENVTSIAGKYAQAEQNFDYVTRAAQIEFNAWHYIDSDLWASLASRIFDGLADELRRPEDKIEVIRRRLRRMIDSSKREQNDAEVAIEAAQNARQQSASDLAKKQEERARFAVKHDAFHLKRIWAAVLKVAPDKNDPKKKEWPDVKKLIKKAEKGARRIGITEVIDNAEEVQRAYTSLQEVLYRGSGLAVSLAANFTGKGLWYSVPVLLFLIALVLGWPWILDKIGTYFDLNAHAIKDMLTPLLRLATVIGAPAIWVGKNLRSISSALGYLEKIRDELREPRVKLDDPGTDEIELKDQIEEIDAQIVTEQRRIEEADRRIAEAQAEIQRINEGGLVYDFLEERIQDSRYLDRLGLISVIRRDFEELGTLLADWQKHNRDIDGEETSPSKHEWDPTPIKRIILYIDDLDRCPPKRVVEVLQAVHLILAFDLFVVVVAVDARWLERSLNESYNPQGESADGSPSGESVHRFSAHNYLEKIFQIPFTLPVMEERGYHKLVSDMIAAPRKQAERIEQQSQEARFPEETAPVSEEESSPSIDDKEPQDDGDQGEDVDTTEKIIEPEVIKQEEEEERARRDKERRLLEEQQRKKEEEEKLRLERQKAKERIKAMLLSNDEELFIKALYPLISTPRLAKRFLNIYRLIRLSAASSQEIFKSFIEQEQGDYRAVLVILAIVVGRAEYAHDILDNLGVGARKKFTTWLKNEYRKNDKTEKPLTIEKMPQNQKDGANSNSSRGEGENGSVDRREAIGGIIKDVNLVIKNLKTLEGPAFDDRLEIYRKWAPEVRRYSFRCHLSTYR